MRKEDELTRRAKYNLVNFTTQSGFDVKPEYGPEDIKALDYQRDLGDVGQFPFTRATHNNLYRNMRWLTEVIGMPLKHPTERVTKKWRHMQQMFNWFEEHPEWEESEMLFDAFHTPMYYHACDAAEEAGVDPDHPLGKAEIGYAGNPHYCLRNLEEEIGANSLEGLYLSTLSAPSQACTPNYAMYVALCEKRGFPLGEMRGFGVNDGLHTHIIRWCNNQPLDVTFKLSTDTMEFSAKNTPKYYPVCPNMYDMRETGITVVQEAALSLCERMAFIDEVIRRGIKFEEIAHRINLSFSGEIDFFETICKIRAARRMWARIAREKYGCTDPKYMRPATGINMAGSAMTAQQPINNITRIALISMACVLAGVRSIQPKCFMEPLPLPWDERTFLPSGNAQHIIYHETGAALVADPLGGSYYVEWLTNKIEEEVTNYMKKIEQRGGIIECIRSGWIQGEVEKETLARQRELEEGKRIKVGVNAFQMPPELDIPMPTRTFEEHEKYQEEILQEIREIKETRDVSRTRETLLKLRYAAKEGENVIRPMVEAFKGDATRGEVIGMVREGMGHSYDSFNMVERPAFLNP